VDEVDVVDMMLAMRSAYFEQLHRSFDSAPTILLIKSFVEALRSG
jgi:hypothetical protein